MKVNIGNYTIDGSGRNPEVQIDAHDCYSLDHTLAMVIAPALTTFRDRVMNPDIMTGIPSCFLVENDDPDLTESCKAFCEALDKMIWSFDQIARDKPDEPDLPPRGPAWGKNADAKEWLDATEQYHLRIQEGIDLFAKHYTNLWE